MGYLDVGRDVINIWARLYGWLDAVCQGAWDGCHLADEAGRIQGYRERLHAVIIYRFWDRVFEMSRFFWDRLA